MSAMTGDKTIKVAITANAPFGDHKTNSSLLVRDALPTDIEGPNKRNIEILKYHWDTLDTWSDIQIMAQEIWGGKRSLFLPSSEDSNDLEVDVDFVLHLGQMSGEGYDFETHARRDGYRKLGEDGKPVDSHYWKQQGAPPILRTGFDVKSAVSKVQKQQPEVVLKVSDDCGLSFCEVRLFASLFELDTKHKAKRGRAAFLHVPLKTTQESIELSRDVAVAYLKALAADPILSSNEDPEPSM